jgi:hypothetical protein
LWESIILPPLVTPVIHVLTAFLRATVGEHDETRGHHAALFPNCQRKNTTFTSCADVDLLIN